MSEPIRISLEFTPNPNTLKFVLNRSLLEKGAANFLSQSRAEHAPLVHKIFDIPGVAAVMVGTNFVTVTKGPNGTWDVLAEEVPKKIELHLGSGGDVFDAQFDLNSLNAAAGAASGNQTEIERKICEVLDTEIRPAVAMDGGDITFGRYEDGVVYLHLQGACSSCPSSIATLRMGVETRLKEVIPEIKEVVQA